ncbi:hypothetical protein T11_1935 [Trichinella zimbabwensis]|uniref:Uncharacterized protein n=1 Tax=Trichinella zimbabwensis TaxID=268475 RepID=A0A0V1I5T4_9BILA|nr:hypothetical protein T11_1935 [Trichinella zimbabwensis]
MFSEFIYGVQPDETKENTNGGYEAARGRHEAEQEKTKSICGSPWIPIL